MGNDVRTKEAVIIGIDVGTSIVKAAAFAVDAPWQHLAGRHYPLQEPEPGRHVQDPDAIREAVRDALAECAAAVVGREVLAIAVSAGMHGLMAMDAERHPLTPLITWADGRATEEAAEVRRSAQAASLHRATGVPLHPMSPLAKLRWFARHDRDVWERARWWVGLKELVLGWLTDEVVTERSSASGTGLYDLRTGSWNDDAVACAGVDPARLPEVRATTDTLPLLSTVADAIGLAPDIPVVLGGADGPLANVGCGAVDPGVVGLSLGTSGAVRQVVAEPVVDGAGTLFCYHLTDGLWVVGGAISNGGRVVSWLADEVLATSAADPDEQARAVLDAAADVAPGSDGLVMLPYLLPERGRYGDPTIPGAYLGLRQRHTRAHLARAAIEGVCLQLRLVLDALDDVVPVESVRATGGAFHSPLWGDILAGALGRPIEIVEGAEGTARGAAALGAVALELAPDLAGALTRLGGPDGDEQRTVRPDPDLVAAAERLRASLPTLASQLAGLGR
jgi:gluconokinase